jgi:polyphosphate kinase
MLVVRLEEGRPVPYSHIGTGNYHVGTAHQYSDVGLLTANRAIGREVIQLFHSLTGHAPNQTYEHLIVAPRDMRRRFYELIRREIEHQRAGGSGRILAKMNALDDPGIIQELYRASQAGVRIDLIVRGHTRLRPRLEGYSDNIRIISILGRFLEHDRVYLFGNGGDPEIFIGSADWRQRNLNSRVEAVVPIGDPSLRNRLVEILETALCDNRLAFELDAEGYYVQRVPEKGEAERNSQEILMRRASAALAASRTWDVPPHGEEGR